MVERLLRVRWGAMALPLVVSIFIGGVAAAQAGALALGQLPPPIAGVTLFASEGAAPPDGPAPAVGTVSQEPALVASAAVEPFSEAASAEDRPDVVTRAAEAAQRP